jgi:hypothetical protein
LETPRDIDLAGAFDVTVLLFPVRGRFIACTLRPHAH